MKKLLPIFLLILFSLNFISATGNCELDKENYIPSETASFECSCDSAAEENAAGFIVWRNSTGTIIENVSTNSGACRTSFFGDSYIFPANSSLYSGNVTFETTSVSWQTVGDVISDNFTVVNYTAFDCLIKNIVTSSSIKVGGGGSLKFDVTDPTSGEAIVHASCSVEADTIDGSPIVFSPEDSGNAGYKMTNADGHVGFRYELIENFWTINTTYEIEMHCFSLPNNTFAELEHVGWLQDSGNAAGMKSCNAEVTFSTNGEDLRPSTSGKDTPSFYFIILLVLIAIVALGFLIEEVWFVVLGGLGFMILGVYTMRYGIVGFRDMFLTWAISLFEISVGVILSIGASIQKMNVD